MSFAEKTEQRGSAAEPEVPGGSGVVGSTLGFGLCGGAFKIRGVSKKHARITELAAQFSGDGVDPRYAGYFILFNQQKFYEAHDVLEDLWLPDRQGRNGNYYKGLIQLAGAFVHLQKNRLKPSSALFKLAQANFEPYPEVHERLNLVAVRLLIFGWLKQLERGEFLVNPLTPLNKPQLALQKFLSSP